MRRVVVTGMGAVTPIGNNVKDFYKNLVDGVNGIDVIKGIDSSDMKVHIAGELKDFDPLVYLDKSEVRKMDEYCQIAVYAATEAFNDSGLKEGDYDPERTGVYIGSGIGGLHTLMRESDKLNKDGPRRVSPHLTSSMISNIAAGHIAIKFNAKGPTLPIVTACATGNHSIGEAYRAIKDGYSDLIFAGGSDSAITRIGVSGFINCMALTQVEDINSACVPFDARRKGFVMAEGGAVLILEEYEKAKARGAKIYAEIVGYGNTCDAYHVTAPDPSAEGLGRAIKLAIQDIDYDAARVNINAHGTGTPLNDKTETLAIKYAFKEDAYKLKVNSIKSMTGHMFAGAGAVEGVASCLSLKNDVVFPTINYVQKDPECDLDYTPNKANFTPLDYVVSTSLGFGGHNAAVCFKKYKD